MKLLLVIFSILVLFHISSCVHYEIQTNSESGVDIGTDLNPTSFSEEFEKVITEKVNVTESESFTADDLRRFSFLSDCTVEVVLSKNIIKLSDIPAQINFSVHNISNDTDYVGTVKFCVDYFDGIDWVTVYSPPGIDENSVIRPSESIDLILRLMPPDNILYHFEYVPGKYRLNFESLCCEEFLITE